MFRWYEAKYRFSVICPGARLVVPDDDYRYLHSASDYCKLAVITLTKCFIYSLHSELLLPQQMRHGHTGVVLCTLRNIQFPPKPIYSLCFSRLDDKICYASSMDGNVYRIEIPNVSMCAT